MAITLSYSDGSLASILYLSSGAGTLPKERVEVHGDRISAVVEDFATTRFFGTSQRRVSGPQDKGFAAEMEAFLSTVQGGEAPIPYTQLRETSLVTFAVLASLRRGRPIDLAAFDAEPAGAALEDPAQEGALGARSESGSELYSSEAESEFPTEAGRCD